jgi:hypothetical protein
MTNNNGRVVQGKLIIDRRGMVTTSDGAKLFRVTDDGVLFLDKKDRRRVSARGGADCVCVSREELIALLEKHCVERADGGAATKSEGE